MLTSQIPDAVNLENYSILVGSIHLIAITLSYKNEKR